MIKVELFYKVSLYGTDWMMTEEEYREFRESALNLPLAMMSPQFTFQPKYSEPGIALLSAKEDQAEECPEYIEPPTLKAPEPDVICENGACRLVFPEDIPEEVQEVPRKKPEKETGNWQKYIDMGNNGASKKEIMNQMMADKDCKISTAGIYYGKYVNPNIKYTKIETLEEDKPAPGKFFTDADRERLQRMTGIK